MRWSRTRAVGSTVRPLGATLHPLPGRARIREILGAIRGAKFPPPPKRKHDIDGEWMVRRVGGPDGRGSVGAGGVTKDDGERGTRR